MTVDGFSVVCVGVNVSSCAIVDSSEKVTLEVWEVEGIVGRVVSVRASDSFIEIGEVGLAQLLAAAYAPDAGVTGVRDGIRGEGDYGADRSVLGSGAHNA